MKFARGWAGVAGFLLFPMVLAYAMMYRFILSVPIQDDYSTVVGFGLDYLHQPNAGARLLYLFDAQYGEYKFVFLHMLVGADLSLTQRIHYPLLMLAGNFFLPAILLVLWFLFAEQEQDISRRVLRFLPVPCVVFALNYADVMNFPSAALDYLPSLFFSMAALALVCRPRERNGLGVYALAVLSALLGYWSAPNAFFAGPLGLVWLARQRQWGRVVVWVAAMGAGLAPYFWHYARATHVGGPLLSVVPSFFLHFAGGAAPVHQLALPLGLLIVGLYGWAIYSGFWKRSPGTFACWTSVLCSAAMTAVGRSNFGVGMSLSSRYKIFSDLLLVFCFQAVAERWMVIPAASRRERRVFAWVLIAAAVFCLRADAFGWKEMKEHRLEVMTGLHAYEADPDRKSPLYFANPQFERDYATSEAKARVVMGEALRAGLFTLPEY